MYEYNESEENEDDLDGWDFCENTFYNEWDDIDNEDLRFQTKEEYYNEQFEEEEENKKYEEGMKKIYWENWKKEIKEIEKNNQNIDNKNDISIEDIEEILF